MGAINFVKTGYGINPGEVFESIVKKAEYEYGHDKYNGTISTCDYSGCRKIADIYTKSVDKKAMKIIEDEDYGQKWEARALDLGVVRYDIIYVKKRIPTIRKKAEYKLRYAVMKYEDNGFLAKVVSHFATKTEADEEAVKLILKNPNIGYYVSKRMINISNGEDKVTEFKVEVSERKSKPKNVPKGCALREIHKYVFYGWASK